jgi:predicted ATPase
MLDLLAELWELQPDTRLGQLIVNTVSEVTAQRPVTTGNIFYIEDNLVEQALVREIDRMRAFRGMAAKTEHK